MASFTLQPRYPEERVAGTHWSGGWVGSTPDLDDVEKRKIFPLPKLELRTQPVASPYTDYAISVPLAQITN
jgi:hypothetical protein